MSPETAALTTLGGRQGRAIGALLLAQYAIVCAVKIGTGEAEEIWWMSHMALLVAGIGLVVQSPLLVATALVDVLILHGLWLVDCSSWFAFGVFPLGITNYLRDANAWVWIATSHHFYLVPLLLVVVRRAGRCPVEALPAAMAIYLFLTVVSRGALSPEANINYAFGVRVAPRIAFFEWANRQSGSLYLPGLNAFVALFMLLPTYLFTRRLVRGRVS